jgi:putative nucleotidyltransferase with HDIG domain
MAALVLSKGLSVFEGLAVLVALCLMATASVIWMTPGAATMAMVACSVGALGAGGRFRGHRNARRAAEEKDTFLELLRILAAAVEVKNAADFNHVVRVAQIAEKLAGDCGLGAQECRKLRIASYVHDIGKLGIPTQILHRQTPPSIDEWELIRNHPTIGATLLAASGMDKGIIETVRYHHEHWDGSGYPEGQAGCNIPLSARILALADACDALLSPRPNRGSFSIEETRSILQKESAKKYDPQLVGYLLNLLEKREVPVYGSGAPAAHGVGSDEVLPEVDAGNSGALGDAVCGIGASEEDETAAGGTRLAQCPNVEEAMKVIAPRVHSLAPYAALVLYTLEERTGTITARFAEGLAAAQLRQNTLLKGQGITGWAIANSQDIVANHAEMDFQAETQQDMPQFECAAVFNLVSEGDPQTSFGAMTLYLDRPELLPQGIRLRMKNLANQVSARLEKITKGETSVTAALSDPITHLPTLSLLYSHAAR